MKRSLLFLLIGGLVLSGGKVFADNAHTERLRAAATVLQEVMETPDREIPQDLLERAHCAVVVPGMKKGAFIFGAQYGKGYVFCRTKNKTGWTAPGTVRLEGGSVGFQIGGSETDVILLVMNARGMERLLSSKFTLGAEASAAAGPVGRNTKAATDAMMTAEILSWSKSRGVFAGVSLEGTTLRQDLADNRALYGKTLENREIIEKEVPAPKGADKLISLLTKYSAKR